MFFDHLYFIPSCAFVNTYLIYVCVCVTISLVSKHLLCISILYSLPWNNWLCCYDPPVSTPPPPSPGIEVHSLNMMQP